jgi:hypothetical protein
MRSGGMSLGERRFCCCDAEVPCGLHALVRRALDGEGRR